MQNPAPPQKIKVQKQKQSRKSGSGVRIMYCSCRGPESSFTHVGQLTTTYNPNRGDSDASGLEQKERRNRVALRTDPRSKELRTRTSVTLKRSSHGGWGRGSKPCKGSQQWGSLALAWMNRLGEGYRGQDERLHMGVNSYGDK